MGFNNNFKKLTKSEREKLKELRTRELEEQSRDEFYLEIHNKIFASYVASISTVLERYPEIRREIDEKFKEIDIESYVWRKDAGYRKWLDEN